MQFPAFQVNPPPWRRDGRAAVHLRGLVISLALLWAIPPGFAWQLYTIEPLDSNGSGESRAAAINRHNWIAGESESDSGSVEAFVWTPEGGLKRIGLEGESSSRALDINDHGVVVGETTAEDGHIRAFRWTEEAGLELLPVTTQTLHSAALAVNNLGDMVGTLEDERGMHAVRWRDGDLSFLHRLPGAGAIQPLDVNDRGDVTGQIVIGGEDATASHAYYFREGIQADHLAEFRLVSALRGSAAVALNEAGTAVGYVMLDSAHVRAFRYNPDAGLELLNDGGAMYSTATDVNDHGWAAGSAIASYAADESACFWRNGRWFDANEVTGAPGGWWLVQITGINDQAVMTGYGTHHERNRSFILRPVPGTSPDDWPALDLSLNEEQSGRGGDRVIVLEAVIPSAVKPRRVHFFANDQPLGSVDQPPFEWGWQGVTDQRPEFFIESEESSGRRLRSPRRMAALPR